MMENSFSFIRVRADLRNLNLPYIKQAWVSVDRSVLRTIRDFKLSLYPKFKLAEDRNVSLYLRECLLPDEESVFLLRDDDVIRVVYENLPSLLGSQCNDFMGFASSSRSSIRHITDGSCEVHFPAAKKARIVSPVLITESFHGISDTQNPTRDGESLVDISAGTNTDIKQSESVRKKHKKRKRCLTEEKSDSFENSYMLENGMNNSISETQEFMLPSDEVGSLIKGTQDQQDENCFSEMIYSKEQKVKKGKRSGKNVTELSKQVNETSDTFENDPDYIHVSKSKDAVLASGAESNGHKSISIFKETVSKKHEVSEKEIPNSDLVQLKKGACAISEGPENCVGVQEAMNKFNKAIKGVTYSFKSAAMDTSHSFLSKTECGGSNMKNIFSHEVSENILSPSLFGKGNSAFFGSFHNVPLQMKGDCTESLGNNCPKKKRTRRGKRKPKVAALSDQTIGDCSSNQLPSSTRNTEESFAEYIYDVINEHNGRKHIRFTESEESGRTITELDNPPKIQCSGNSTDKPSSVAVDTSNTLQESFKPEVFSLCENAEKVIPETLFHQEELASCAVQNDCVGGTKSEINVQETKESVLKERTSKSYEDYPLLNRCPVVGEVVAFRMLELTDSYCPEVSGYKEGKVVKTGSSADVLEIDLVKEQVILRTGKFENLYPEEAVEPQVIKKVEVQWSGMIEPRLIS